MNYRVQPPLSFLLKNFIMSQKQPVQVYRWFEKILNLKGIKFSKIRPNIAILEAKNATFEFLAKDFF